MLGVHCIVNNIQNMLVGIMLHKICSKAAEIGSIMDPYFENKLLVPRPDNSTLIQNPRTKLRNLILKNFAHSSPPIIVCILRFETPQDEHFIIEEENTSVYFKLCY